MIDFLLKKIWDLPAAIRRFARIILDVQEAQSIDWLSARTIRIDKARPACCETYGAFPVKGDWARTETGLEARYVYTLRDVEVAVPSGYVAVDKHIIAESVGNQATALGVGLVWRFSRFVFSLLGRVRELPENGESGYIFVPYKSYFHFVMESMVSLAFALKFNPDSTVLYDESHFKGFYRGYLELLVQRGVVHRLLPVRSGCVFKIPRLILCGKEPDSGMLCKSSVEIVRWVTGLRDGAVLPDKKIFITRRGTRQFDNQKELERVAQECGYEVVDTDGMPVAEQISLINGSSAVVANHGAGLVNLIYAKSGIKVIELFSRGWLVDCFFRISQICGLKYQCIVAKEADKWGVVDVEEFKNKLSGENE